MNAQLKIRPEIGNPGDVFRFITMSHQTTMAVGLRRMIDRGPHAQSLYRVLTAIADKHFVIRRSDYARRYGPDEASRARGRDDFHSLVGHKCPEYPASLAVKHRTKLTRLVSRVSDWVDRRIAHNDSKCVSVPKILHLTHAWNACWIVHCRYHLALTGVSTSADDSLLISADWQRPLGFPWFFDEVKHVGLQMPVDSGDARINQLRRRDQR